MVKKIQFRDILLFSGIFLLGYGLYLFKPWVSFTICGLFIMIGGFFMKEN